MADETFGEFANAWLREHEPQLASKTRLDYSWQLSNHLLPFFAEHPLSAITIADKQLDAHAAQKGGRDQRGGLVYRHTLLATLLFAGLRMSELTQLRWREVDLHGGRLRIEDSKTSAGLREVDLLPVLAAELSAHRRRASSIHPDAFVFATAAGTRPDQGNIRRRVFYRAVARADALLHSSGQVPLPRGLTPHKLRHTYASILIATGVDPGVAMEQLGHADPGFTLRVYRHAMRRSEAEREALARFVSGQRRMAGQKDAIRRPGVTLEIDKEC